MIVGTISLILIVAIIVYLLLPVMQPVEDGAHYFVSGKSRKQDLQDEKSVILANLQDLRIEAESGKIPDEELRKLSAPLLRSLDRLEKELSRYPTSESRGQDERFCPACGYLRKEDSSVCYQCGLALKEEATS